MVEISTVSDFESRAARAWALRQNGVGAEKKLLLMILALRADASGRLVAALEGLAFDAELAPAKLFKNLEGLEKSGLIKTRAADAADRLAIVLRIDNEGDEGEGGASDEPDE